MKIPLAALLVLAAGAAQAMDSSPGKRGLNLASAVVKSKGGLRIAQASGSASKSSVEKPPVKIVGGKKEDILKATNGPDIITGGAGKDEFDFVYKPYFPNKTTLDDGDRIVDYEFGERIKIEGVNIDIRHIKLVYDAKKKETRLELDLPDKKGAFDGKVDRTIILTGDKRGKLRIDGKCCTGTETEIYIDKVEKPKTAEKKAKKKKRFKRRHAKPKLHKVRHPDFPPEDPSAAGGSE